MSVDDERVPEARASYTVSSAPHYSASDDTPFVRAYNVASRVINDLFADRRDEFTFPSYDQCRTTPGGVLSIPLEGLERFSFASVQRALARAGLDRRQIDVSQDIAPRDASSQARSIFRNTLFVPALHAPVYAPRPHARPCVSLTRVLGLCVLALGAVLAYLWTHTPHDQLALEGRRLWSTIHSGTAPETSARR